MRYIKPIYYDQFCCTADQCPDTCCAGWQIMIDDDSLKKYSKVTGVFGKRLRKSIDWEEGAFCQYAGRCAFLNDANLCDIYAELGSDSLCDTCRRYPRHVEEYEGLREWSLSLSCPVAAGLILGGESFPIFLTEEDDREDELQEEFEEFDLLLFTQLEDARNIVLEHLQVSKAPLEEKLHFYLRFAEEMQECIDKEAYFEIDDIVRKYEACQVIMEKQEGTQSNKEDRFAHRKKLYQNMLSLERLRLEWSGVLIKMKKTLYEAGKESYDRHLKNFEKYLQENPDELKCWEDVGIRLFVFFLYTYFCGAVYDDWIYSKMALAVESVRFLRELYMAEWVSGGKLEKDQYVELAYRYAREIEHSDLNLNMLEEIFMEGRSWQM